MTAIFAFLTAYAAPVLGSVMAGAALTWVLGRLTDSEAGKGILAKAMRQSRRIGRTASALGNSRFGALWNPIETFGTTWIRSIINEFFVGLREDNLDKLVDEKERLDAVGSVHRSEAVAKAIGDKIEALGKLPEPMQTAQDAAMFQRLNRFTSESSNSKLKEG